MKRFDQASQGSYPNNKTSNEINQSIDHLASKKTGSHLPPKPDFKKYNRQQSIIDGLTQNKMNSMSNLSNNGSIPVVETQYLIMNKTPSIELLLHEEEIKSQNPLVRKIEDIFVNKATLSSKQINSSMLLKNINEPLFIPKQPQQMTTYVNKSPHKNTNNRVSQLNQENFTNSPDKSSSKPFLRKKSSEKISHNSQLAAMQKEKANRQNQSIFDLRNLNTNINNIKSYNQKLQKVLENIQQIKKSGRLDNQMDFKLNNDTDIQILKFMVEKAILRKDERIS